MKRTVRGKAGVLVGFVLCLFLVSCPPFGRGARKPAHVFLLIGDGMGYSSQIIASRYLYGSDDALAWEAFPFKAWASTYSASVAGYDAGLAGTSPWPLSGETPESLAYLLSAYTDSAAAATAMACGVKTHNGQVGWKDGIAVENVCELLAREIGAGIGVISSVPFNHATPAAFLVHAPDRTDYLGIAESVRAGRLPRIIVSGGDPLFCPTYLSNEEADAFRGTPGWTVLRKMTGVNGNDALESAAISLGEGNSLLAISGGADGSLETPLPLDRPGWPEFVRSEDDPSLAVSVVSAARLLSRDGKPSFIMAEQGDIDWANHKNDLGLMIGAIASLDQAVRALIAFIGEEGDTVTEQNSLIIVTADHATGLPRFQDGTGMVAGALPARVGAGLPGIWEYPGGSRVEYRTGGHANELVRLAVWPEGAAKLFEARSDGNGIVDDTAVFSAVQAFALE